MREPKAEIEKKRRRPMRMVFRLVILGALVYLGIKFLETQKEEFMGLTETEAKAKIKAMLHDRVGEENASQIADQVVAKLSEKGILQPDPV